jgi:mannosyl-oligosaccharide alpha-1,2-mannosidase
MFRYRRYRVFLFLAVVFVVLVWRFNNPASWDGRSPISASAQQQLDRLGLHASKPKTDKKPDQPPDPPKIPSDANKVKPEAPGAIAKPTQNVIAGPPATPKEPEQKKEPKAPEKAPEKAAEKAPEKDTPKPELKNVEPIAGKEIVLAEGGEGRWSQDHLPTNVVVEHWSARPPHFPIPTESISALPTGKPKKIPRIQATFETESQDARDSRVRKLNTIKDAFIHAWKGYKEHAWGKDEVSPVTGTPKNTFNGWRATLVDALDTMWMMGLTEQFEEAVEHVKTIDFHTSDRHDIPLFETTIRYLGGLIGAYEVSEAKYPVLLEKATALGDILHAAFDTPNHMPSAYFAWKQAFTSQAHRAPARIVLAELGTLQLEFTRLSQLTGNNTYYDVVSRIVDALEIWQDNTRVPGLWPSDIDASGCNMSTMYTTPSFKMSTLHQKAKAQSEAAATPAAAADKQGLKLARRQIGAIENDVLLPPTIPKTNRPRPKDIPATPATHLAECVAKGLDSGPSGADMFSLGANSDSAYEYLSKMWLLLGGQLDNYKTMFEKAMDAANNKLIYRIMIPNEKRELLAAGDLSVSPYTTSPFMAHYVTHLTCFAGGMFAMGAKIFDRPADLEIAAKLTDGCVWAYESTATGIMAEKMQAVACDSRKSCPWNETKWWEAVDPQADVRQEMFREETRRYNINLEKLAASKTAAAAATKVEDDKARAVVTAAQQGSREPPAGFDPHAAEKEPEKKKPLEKREEPAKPEEATFTPPPVVEEPELSPPVQPLGLEAFAKQKIELAGLKPGVKSLDDTRYILRYAP